MCILLKEFNQGVSFISSGTLFHIAILLFWIERSPSVVLKIIALGDCCRDLVILKFREVAQRDGKYSAIFAGSKLFFCL